MMTLFTIETLPFLTAKTPTEGKHYLKITPVSVAFLLLNLL